MLLIVAFLLFASLFAGWLLAPSSAPTSLAEPAAEAVPETGTSPA